MTQTVRDAAIRAEAGLTPFEGRGVLEWLDADGLGGYASGTLSGIPLRRYHGLLLVARDPPHDRVMLVNQLEEVLELPSGDVVLSGGESESEGGWRYCSGFVLWPIPTWRYEVDGVVLERSITRPRGTPRAVIGWTCVSADKPLRLRLRPMLTGRGDHDAQTKSSAIDDGADLHDGHVSWQPHRDFPRVHTYTRAAYRHDPRWKIGVEYPIDRERGEVCQEDWWSPGEFTFELRPGDTETLTFSTDGTSSVNGEAAIVAEKARRRAARHPPSGSSVIDALRVSAESYAVDFPSGSAPLAGFPWFGIWTRDTFTSFGGLYLATGEHAAARRVLATFSPLVKSGMLPANLPDALTRPRWNAADASLWFVISVGRYVRYTGDATILDAFAMRAVCAIMDGYSAGEPPHIQVDTDGLVHASAPDQALTWMDADYESHIMTPRRGKPVEIQALWVHALAVAARLSDMTGDHAFADRCRQRRAKAVESFRSRFWNEKAGYLFDVVDGPDGDDPTLTPNQIFAIALDDDLLPRAQAMAVLRVVDERLRTPFGLRTLPSDHPRYHAHYVGPQSDRDPAYHQGTVWPFLLGPFISAWVRLHDRSDESRHEALGFLTALEAHLYGDGCLGHVSEIFDAEPPYTPRGCFAQGWSGGELLFSLHEHVIQTA